MRGTVSAQSPWDVMVDLFFYREPEEAKEDGEALEGVYAGQPQTHGMQSSADLLHPIQTAADTCSPQPDL